MHISIAAEKVFEIAGFPITNSMIATIVVSVALILFALFYKSRLKIVPSKFQVVVEMIVGTIYDLAKSISPKHADEFFPLVATIFIFVLFSNWFGLIPGLPYVGFTETVHGKEVFVPLFRAATADLNTTLALATTSMIAVWYYSIKHLGLFAHLGKFINFKSPIGAFVGILELVSEFSKIISFAFRLFGNIFAGEVLLAVMMFLIPAIIPLPFLGMEFFVGFIQALVFSVLTMVFISGSLEAHG